MQRVGFLLRVKPERLEEYRRLHVPIWPELTAELKAAGMRNYSLWLRAGDGLEFGYLECDDWAAVCAHMAKSEINARWQRLMQEYLDTGTDPAMGGQPIQMLERVFQLE